MKALIFSLILVFGFQGLAQDPTNPVNPSDVNLEKNSEDRTEGSTNAPGHTTCSNCKTHESNPATLNRTDESPKAGTGVAGQAAPAGSQKKPGQR